MDVLVRENVWGDLEACQNRESQGRLNKYLASENPDLKFGFSSGRRRKEKKREETQKQKPEGKLLVPPITQGSFPRIIIISSFMVAGKRALWRKEMPGINKGGDIV